MTNVKRRKLWRDRVADYQASELSVREWCEKSGGLVVFLEDGRLEISNNRPEQSIKPFVIGRKNWLFANTPRGARTSPLIYSLVETAKQNGLNPLDYLRFALERLRS